MNAGFTRGNKQASDSKHPFPSCYGTGFNFGLKIFDDVLLCLDARFIPLL